MAHDETNRTDRRTFLQAGALATAAAAEPGPRPARRRMPPAKPADAPQADAGQDRRRGHDARAGDRPGRRLRPDPAALVRQRRPRLRHRQGLRHRARLQEVVRAGPRGPQADLPRHQGHAPRRPTQMLEDGRRAAGGPGDRLHRPLLHPRPGRRAQLDDAINFVKSQEFKETAEAIRKSGKAKFIGFSTHHKDRAADHPGGGRGGDRRRDHAPVHPLARQGLAAQQGARRLLEARASA